MTKNNVIRAFCRLATKVGEERFKNSVAHDCFCTSEFSIHDPTGFRFDPEVLEFIQEAVDKALLCPNPTP